MGRSGHSSISSLRNSIRTRRLLFTGSNLSSKYTLWFLGLWARKFPMPSLSLWFKAQISAISASSSKAKVWPSTPVWAPVGLPVSKAGGFPSTSDKSMLRSTNSYVKVSWALVCSNLYIRINWIDWLTLAWIKSLHSLSRERKLILMPPPAVSLLSSRANSISIWGESCRYSPKNPRGYAVLGMFLGFNVFMSRKMISKSSV